MVPDRVISGLQDLARARCREIYLQVGEEVVARDSGRTKASFGKNRQPALAIGSEGQACTDVLLSQVGELFDQLLMCHAARQIFEYIGNRHASAADAGLPAALVRFNSDDLVIIHT